MEKQCNETEGVRLLETMRRICAATGCEEVEHATLAYETELQEASMPRQDKQQAMKEGAI